ncbi:siderophore-interacting protein [Streptodolium elevatio]|uniref:Siderophore-interacting protein n=1 Tax=Streptodolium elevatio TaxID=3157996 RepID=A0ABV3DJU6_9ACTN
MTHDAGTAPTRGLGSRLLDRMFARGTVTEVEQIAARMRRVRIGGEGVAGLAWTPGQQVRLHVNELFAASSWKPGALGDVLRTYSVWDYDASGVLDLCVFDHGGTGPGGRWGREAEPGLSVRLGKPEGSMTPRREAAYHVFVGEETAQVAFGPMLSALGDDARVFGAVETATEDDRLPLPRADDIAWTERGDRSAASSDSLVESVRGLALPDEPGIAYVAGEARTVQAVRAHLVRDRGWPRRSVLVKPFWTPGKKGME